VSLTSEKHRFHLLDALRGMAAVLVVYWHAPLYLGLRAKHLTYLAVDFFFCLSGFVIAYTYQQRLESGMTVWAFVKTRLIRLYPVYLFGAVLGSVPLLAGHMGHHPATRDLVFMAITVVTQWLMLPHLGDWPNHVLYPANGPSWSIFFEVVANIGFAILVRARKASSTVLAVICLASLGGLLVLLRSEHTLNFGWSNDAWQIGGGLLRVFLSFPMGVLLYRIYRALGNRLLAPAVSTWVAVGLCCLLLVLLQWALPGLSTEAGGMLVISVIFPLMILLAAHAKVPAWANKGCALLGDLSYPVYLTHAPLMSVFEVPRIRGLVLSHASLQLWVVPSVLLVSGVLSFVLLKVYDEPLRRWLRERGRRS